MLDDDAGRLREALDTFPGRVGIRDVVVREFFALHLMSGHERSGRWIEVAIVGGLLVGVFPVAQILQLDE